jgi:putative ABC transport system permease protein
VLLRVVAVVLELGTNLLTVTNGQDYLGQPAELPGAASAMIGQLPGVTAVQDTAAISGIDAYRSPLIPPIDTDALSVDAASLGLPAAVGTSMAQGSYLNAATAREPVAVLGYGAAQLMGIDRIWPGERIWAGGRWFYLAGILHPATLVLQIDTSVLIGLHAARQYLGFDEHPSEAYVRTVNTQAATTSVDALLGAQANPQDPSAADVSQPSDTLTAQADAVGAFDTLFLGLGAVALLVGAVGVANIMIISVLERRQEIGLRRALGATKGQIRIQFLAEAILLALAGGATGDIADAAATAIYAHAKDWPIVIPPKHGPAASLPPPSSAPSPACCPPSAPPAYHPHKHSGPCEPCPPHHTPEPSADQARGFLLCRVEPFPDQGGTPRRVPLARRQRHARSPRARAAHARAAAARLRPSPV